MIVAIDGPAGAGKSSVARGLARALGWFFLDTGAMYRAVTLVALHEGVAPEDGEALGRLAQALDLDFDGEGRILINGECGEPEVRSAAVNARVSVVAAHPSVRAATVARQRAVAERLAAEGRGLVAEGRDTTTTVFPEADHKFYLHASPAVRARRRAAQEGRPLSPAELRDLEAELEARDALDSGREHSPLRQAPDAVLVETDDRSLEEVVAALKEALERG